MKDWKELSKRQDHLACPGYKYLFEIFHCSALLFLGEEL